MTDQSTNCTYISRLVVKKGLFYILLDHLLRLLRNLDPNLTLHKPNHQKRFVTCEEMSTKILFPALILDVFS